MIALSSTILSFFFMMLCTSGNTIYPISENGTRDSISIAIAEYIIVNRTTKRAIITRMQDQELETIYRTMPYFKSELGKYLKNYEATRELQPELRKYTEFNLDTAINIKELIFKDSAGKYFSEGRQLEKLPFYRPEYRIGRILHCDNNQTAIVPCNIIETAHVTLKLERNSTGKWQVVSWIQESMF